ncbi:MAG: AAA family ATPase, partial [Patescibacteria group bacterium]
NGSGKSTFLEAIADRYGFGREGGSKNISFETSSENSSTKLANAVKLSWTQKILGGYFFRAESFFNVASYIDDIQKIDGKAYLAYGGESLHKQSHGESFLSLFQNRFSRGGFFLLDEPEAALSPQRQLSLLVLLNKICQNKNTQFIIATHSPILLAYPDAQIFSFDSEKIEEIKYEDTKPYQITKSFLNNKHSYIKRLFNEE